MAKLVKTEDEIMLADAARGFLNDAAPVAHLRKLRDAGQTHDPELWKSMAEMGWAGVLIPEDAGGSDMGHAAAGVIARELGQTLVSSPFLGTAVIAATALRKAGRSDTLAKIAGGDVIYAIALDENTKFAPEAIEMQAKSSGNGFVLSGEKQFVVDAGIADRVLVLARAEAGLTLFDLPVDQAGLAVDARDMIDSRNAATLRFDGVEAPGDDVLGAPGEAMEILRPALEAGQAALASELTGLTAGAFDMTVGYLKERKQFGVPIGVFQALQHRAADLWCETEITASAVLNAGRVLDETPDEATLAVSLAKARATDTAIKAVKEGVQMHGGIGMTDEFDMGFYMKRARVAAEWLGDYGYHADIVARARGF